MGERADYRAAIAAALAGVTYKGKTVQVYPYESRSGGRSAPFVTIWFAGLSEDEETWQFEVRLYLDPAASWDDAQEQGDDIGEQIDDLIPHDMGRTGSTAGWAEDLNMIVESWILAPIRKRVRLQ